jgi:hypothetical protein
MHQSASTNQHWYRMIKEHDLDVITFTAWRAPPGAAPVLYSLIETIYIVAFGTLREKELLPTAIRACFMAVKSYGIFDAVSINGVSDKIDSFDFVRRTTNYANRNNILVIKAKNALRNLRSEYLCGSGLEECVAIEMHSLCSKREGFFEIL